MNAVSSENRDGRQIGRHLGKIGRHFKNDVRCKSFAVIPADVIDAMTPFLRETSYARAYARTCASIGEKWRLCVNDVRFVESKGFSENK